ncbi:nuclear transport factor 2 family protein [Micromonospora sp. WMMD723]|uniref:nuclear transport factor 2 family protein n=1 Tax=unclassified Micromonospora TaxID=2617518 RepID=UPI003B93EE2E
MDLTHQEIFQRYVYAGAVTRDPDAIAALFTEDGVYEAPLAPAGHPLHGRLVGRAAIRAGTSAYHQLPTHQGTVNQARSAHLLHDTPDPDVFIAEIDVAFDGPDGQQTTMSLVQIFRLRAGRIAVLRDYFTEPPADASAGR